MPNPDFKKPQQFALNHVWDDGAQAWVPQSVSTGTGSDVNVTNTSLDVHNYVWDTNTLDWVEQEQGGAGGGDASLAEQQTQTTHLAAIETAVEILDNIVAGNEAQVDVVSSALPTGAATEATLSALNTKVATAKTSDYDTGAGTDTVEMVGLALPGAGGAVAGGTSTNPVRVDPTGSTTQPVSAASLPLPTGAATAANQATGNTSLATLAGAVAGTEVQVDVLTSALPTGASTSAKQDTAQTALDAIKTAIEILDNIVSGAEAQVDIVGALPAGTNNIGDVDVASLPALAAGTNLIGRVAASPETNTVYDGTTALTPKFAAIDAASSGDNTLVAAVNPKKIRVLAAFLVSAGTVNVRFESGAGGSALTGQMNLIANTGFVLPFNPAGWFETASNTLLNLELSAGVSVDGALTYVEV
jgi:hypothetical protein